MSKEEHSVEDSNEERNPQWPGNLLDRLPTHNNTFSTTIPMVAEKLPESVREKLRDDMEYVRSQTTLDDNPETRSRVKHILAFASEYDFYDLLNCVKANGDFAIALIKDTRLIEGQTWQFRLFDKERARLEALCRIQPELRTLLKPAHNPAYPPSFGEYHYSKYDASNYRRLCKEYVIEIAIYRQELAQQHSEAIEESPEKIHYIFAKPVLFEINIPHVANITSEVRGRTLHKIDDIEQRQKITIAKEICNAINYIALNDGSITIPERFAMIETILSLAPPSAVHILIALTLKSLDFSKILIEDDRWRETLEALFQKKPDLRHQFPGNNIHAAKIFCAMHFIRTYPDLAHTPTAQSAVDMLLATPSTILPSLVELATASQYFAQALIGHEEWQKRIFTEHRATLEALCQLDLTLRTTLMPENDPRLPPPDSDENYSNSYTENCPKIYKKATKRRKKISQERKKVLLAREKALLEREEKMEYSESPVQTHRSNLEKESSDKGEERNSDIQTYTDPLDFIHLGPKVNTPKFKESMARLEKNTNEKLSNIIEKLLDPGFPRDFLDYWYIDEFFSLASPQSADHINIAVECMISHHSFAGRLAKSQLWQSTIFETHKKELAIACLLYPELHEGLMPTADPFKDNETPTALFNELYATNYKPLIQQVDAYKKTLEEKNTTEIYYLLDAPISILSGCSFDAEFITAEIEKSTIKMYSEKTWITIPKEVCEAINYITHNPYYSDDPRMSMMVKTVLTSTPLEAVYLLLELATVKRHFSIVLMRDARWRKTLKALLEEKSYIGYLLVGDDNPFSKIHAGIYYIRTHPELTHLPKAQSATKTILSAPSHMLKDLVEFTKASQYFAHRLIESKPWQTRVFTKYRSTLEALCQLDPTLRDLLMDSNDPALPPPNPNEHSAKTYTENCQKICEEIATLRKQIIQDREKSLIKKKQTTEQAVETEEINFPQRFLQDAIQYISNRSYLAKSEIPIAQYVISSSALLYCDDQIFKCIEANSHFTAELLKNKEWQEKLFNGCRRLLGALCLLQPTLEDQLMPSIDPFKPPSKYLDDDPSSLFTDIFIHDCEYLAEQIKTHREQLTTLAEEKLAKKFSAVTAAQATEKPQAEGSEASDDSTSHGTLTIDNYCIIRATQRSMLMDSSDPSSSDSSSEDDNDINDETMSTTQGIEASPAKVEEKSRPSSSGSSSSSTCRTVDNRYAFTTTHSSEPSSLDSSSEEDTDINDETIEDARGTVPIPGSP